MAERLVVFDANVYIRAAQQYMKTGWPSAWNQGPASLNQACLAAIAAVCEVCGPSLTVSDTFIYGSSSLEDVIVRKLTQPLSATRSEDTGLGWSEADLVVALDPLLQAVADTQRLHWFDPSPRAEALQGADYEDSCVWALFLKAMGARPTCDPILVTNDRSFASVVNLEAVKATGNLLFVAQSAADFVLYLQT